MVALILKFKNRFIMTYQTYHPFERFVLAIHTGFFLINAIFVRNIYCLILESRAYNKINILGTYYLHTKNCVQSVVNVYDVFC